MQTKDIASKYFLEVLSTNSPSMINHMLPSFFLSMSLFTHESAETEEHFREIHN